MYQPFPSAHSSRVFIQLDVKPTNNFLTILNRKGYHLEREIFFRARLQVYQNVEVVARWHLAASPFFCGFASFISLGFIFLQGDSSWLVYHYRKHPIVQMSLALCLLHTDGQFFSLSTPSGSTLWLRMFPLLLLHFTTTYWRCRKCSQCSTRRSLLFLTPMRIRQPRHFNESRALLQALFQLSWILGIISRVPL